MTGNTSHDDQGVWEYQTPAPGPNVLILGGIHGNEPCGVYAIDIIRSQIESGELCLLRGKLTLIKGNLLAIERNVRYVDENLNRLFKDVSSGDSLTGYEVERAEVIKPYIRQADFQLDLHSTRSASVPFLMAEPHLKDDALEFYSGKIVIGFGSLDCSAISGDTELYGHTHGVKSFTMENGQHDSEAAKSSALSVSMNFLRYTGILAGCPESGSRDNLLRLKEVVLKKNHSFKFSKTFGCFTELKRGDLIATECAAEHRAPRECTLVILCDDVPSKRIGEEVYFLADQELCP